MKNDLIPEKTEQITKEMIINTVSRAITILTNAKNHYEQKAAIKNASNIIDMFEVAKKANEELEEKLEEARREIIKAIDNVKIERSIQYDKAKKSGEVHGQGRSKKQNAKTPERSGVSEKPKQNDLGMNDRRVSEERKIADFDAKHPGVRERIINKKPKKETVSKNISLKIVEFATKNKDKKPEKKLDLTSKVVSIELGGAAVMVAPLS
jgi:hypothetical protein